MKTASDSLPEDTKTLKDIVLDLQLKLLEKDSDIDHKDLEITHLKQQVQHILEQFRLAQQKQFGKSSEVSQDQLGLFNEPEEIAVGGIQLLRR